jgi:glycosyltransferase involved in cell wall biosynthesis
MRTTVEISSALEELAVGVSGNPQERSTMISSPSRPKAGERPHILFLMDQYFGTHGGAEGALLNIIRHLPTERFRCSLATFGMNPAIDRAKVFPCPVYEFPLRRTYDWTAMKVAARLRRLIRDEHVDIVHTFFETSDIWGGMVAKLSGCPVLVSSRRDMGILRSWKHHVAYRLMNRYVDLVLPVSDEVRNYAIERDGLDPEKAVTLYNGVELERIVQVGDEKSLRASLGLGDASPIVLTVANIRHVKGIDVFVRAAALACREFPGALFLVAGHFSEPDCVQRLQELIRDLGLAKNVRLLGGTGKIFSLLNLSNVFCLLSRSEGFSNALLEAMACSLPCVATRVGGNAEAIAEGQSGFLVENEDAQAAAERIGTLLRNPAQARQMGAAGRRIVETRFTIDVMMRQLVSLYEGLVAPKESAG